MKSRIKAIIFDYDGVIVLSEESRFRVIQATAARHGVPIGDEALAKISGRRTKDFFDLVIPEVSLDTRSAITAEYELEYKGNITQHVTRIAATVDFIQQYEGEALLAIASTSDYKLIRTITKQFGIFEKLRAIISNTDVQRLKPDPQAYEMAAARLGIAPTDCAAIEDTPIGAQSALSANIKTYALLNGFNSSTDFENLPVTFIRTAADIQAILL